METANLRKGSTLFFIKVLFLFFNIYQKELPLTVPILVVFLQKKKAWLYIYTYQVSLTVIRGYKHKHKLVQ